MTKRIGIVEIVDHQLAVALDHREQVIEVMGDAAGQPTHGFHFLGLT